MVSNVLSFKFASFSDEKREVLTNVIHFSCRFPNDPRVYANGVNFVLYHLLNKKGLERTQTPNACIFFPCILQIL